MKKSKNGFTLIELLAVIVILAIIALIAVPVIMNIINKANKSAFKDSAYGVISAGELYYAERQLEPNGMTDDVTFNLPDETKALQLKGEVPTGTILITKEGKVAIAVYNNRYCVTKGIDDKDVIIIENYENCEITLPEKTLSEIVTTSEEVTSIPECIKNKVLCAPGTPVAFKVNENEVYNFYVIDETESEITLIMDRNLGGAIAWYSDGDDTTDNETNELGPITALNYLNNETSTWTNISPIKEYTYINQSYSVSSTHGYQRLEVKDGIGKIISQYGNVKTTLVGTMRARFLTREESDSLLVPETNKPPKYLYGNLESPVSATQFNFGYWYLTARPCTETNVHTIDCFGQVTCSRNVYDNSMFGIRPVITLKK